MADEVCLECGAVNRVFAPETKVAGGAFEEEIWCVWCGFDMPGANGHVYASSYTDQRGRPSESGRAPEQPDDALIGSGLSQRTAETAFSVPGYIKAQSIHEVARFWHLWR